MRRALFGVVVVLLVAGAVLTLAGVAGLRPPQDGAQAPASTPAAVCGGADGAGCAYCGQQNPAAAGTSGTATLKGDYQEAYVEVNGGYIPETLEVKAGVPLRLTFSRGTSSCDSIVVLPFANSRVDVSQGPKVVEVPPLAPGTYEYSCGMRMLFGRIVAK